MARAVLDMFLAAAELGTEVHALSSKDCKLIDLIHYGFDQAMSGLTNPTLNLLRKLPFLPYAKAYRRVSPNAQSAKWCELD